jgi:hypothetical protein
VPVLAVLSFALLSLFFAFEAQHEMDENAGMMSAGAQGEVAKTTEVCIGGRKKATCREIESVKRRRTS